MTEKMVKVAALTALVSQLVTSCGGGGAAFRLTDSQSSENSPARTLSPGIPLKSLIEDPANILREPTQPTTLPIYHIQEHLSPYDLMRYRQGWYHPR